MSLLGKRILITGVGIKPVGHIFKDKVTKKPSHTPVTLNNEEYKANIGTATALECAKAGAVVHIVSHTEKKLEIIKKWIKNAVPNSQVEYSITDLNSKEDLQQLIDQLPLDLPLYWVQSVGLGAGTVHIKDDNPYLPFEEVPFELVQAEHTVLTGTILLFQLLLPRFRQQNETRVCIITSMSAIRGYPFGTVHTSAKGALSRFINALRFEVDKNNIFVTDIRPGMVDTGLYDTQSVREALSQMDQAFGNNHGSNDGIFVMPPTSIGKTIVTVLASEAHFLSVNMVARGQEFTEAS